LTSGQPLDALVADDLSGTHLPDDLSGNETLGSYRLESRLGGGGMGHVYKAVASDGTTVAVKLVKEDLAHDTTFRKRFEREARIAKSLQHPNIVSVIESGDSRQRGERH
jgi:serine/threonine protein kinase